MLCNRIKELRLANHLSQVELANNLSVTKQTVSNWENNNIQPSIDMLIKIADYFKVSTDYLLDRTDTKTIDVTSLSSEQIAHLTWIIKDISKE